MAMERVHRPGNTGRDDRATSDVISDRSRDLAQARGLDPYNARSDERGAVPANEWGPGAANEGRSARASNLVAQGNQRGRSADKQHGETHHRGVAQAPLFGPPASPDDQKENTAPAKANAGGSDAKNAQGATTGSSKAMLRPDVDIPLIERKFKVGARECKATLQFTIDRTHGS